MLARDGGGSFCVNLVPNFSGETRIPECQRLTIGAETLVTEVRGEVYLDRLHDWMIIQISDLERDLVMIPHHPVSKSTSISSPLKSN